MKRNKEYLMSIYNEIERKGHVSSNELARTLSVTSADIRVAVAELRDMYFEEELNKFVCTTKHGYFLSDKLSDASRVYDRYEKQGKTMLYKASQMKKRMITEDNLKLEV